jgi:hypothetical protein
MFGLYRYWTRRASALAGMVAEVRISGGAALS